MVADVSKHLLDLVILLAEAEHDARLGEDVGAEFFGPLEHTKAAVVAGLRAHLAVEPFDRLEVVVEDMKVFRKQRCDGALLLVEV